MDQMYPNLSHSMIRPAFNIDEQTAAKLLLDVGIDTGYKKPKGKSKK